MTHLLLAALLVAAAPALAETALQPQDDIQSVSYACAQDQTMEVVFLNTAEGNSYAVVMVEGELIPMQIAVSGSGARYLSIGPQPTRQLWTAKGGADLVVLDGQAETPLRSDCTLAGEGPGTVR